MTKGIIDAITGFVLIGAVTLGFMFTFELAEQTSSSTSQFGPAFFPNLILVCMALCAVPLIIKGVRLHYREKEKLSIDRARMIRISLLIITLIVYVVLFLTIGFLFSTLLYLVVGQLLFGVKKPSLLLGTTILIPISFYFIFTTLFKVPLP
jgi:putative tricarboxylic transport membrane protein